jgi:isopentenyl phosphate kinase
LTLTGKNHDPEEDVRFLVVKIGGSLFSDKSRAGYVDEAAFDRLAARVAALHRAALHRAALHRAALHGAAQHEAAQHGAAQHGADGGRVAGGRVVLVTGGGAIGHGALRASDTADPFGTIGFAGATSTVRWRWVEALRRRSVRAFPLQLGAFATAGPHGPLVAADALHALLGAGVLPVLSGDCVLAADGSLAAVSSDATPEYVAAALGEGTRVAMLTDVPGIVMDGPGGGRVLSEVDARRPAEAYGYLWPHSEWDASGAMHGKLDSLVRCALAGAECFILSGADGAGAEGAGAEGAGAEGAGAETDLQFLFGPVAGWPASLSYTRIAGDRLAAPAN